MEELEVLYIFGIFFLIVSAILALLMPFFVLRIRNEAIKMNKKMSKVVAMIENEKTNNNRYISDNLIKCPSCNTCHDIDKKECHYCGSEFTNV